MTKDRKKIIVAMSGGVDSSVAAALLLERGYEVVGAFMKNWSGDKDRITGACGWRKEREDAVRVAAKLDIPLVTFDFEKEYGEKVVDYMVREYQAGRTPNPDVLCNKMVKFDLFLKRAEEIGGEMIATGHYARLADVPDGTGKRLLRGVDQDKDQSYFLHQLDQSQLAKTFFPVGHLTKAEVRAKARKLGLSVAGKKDSQGICFIGQVDLREFLKERLGERVGPIVTTDGRVVGQHRGAAPFTIGQRHGLGVGGGTPYFVVDKDMSRNAVYVAPADDDRQLYAGAVRLEGIHWIGAVPERPFGCSVRIRYRQPLQSAVVTHGEGGSPVVAFDDPQRAVSPGQFAVFYDGETCLGGGVIATALTEDAR